MTIIWLLVWLLASTPAVTWPGSWAVGLTACVLVDLLWSPRAIGRFRR